MNDPIDLKKPHHFILIIGTIFLFLAIPLTIFGTLNLKDQKGYSANKNAYAATSQKNKGFYTTYDILPGESLQTGESINKLNWGNLETSPGIYSFSKLNDALKPAVSAGKPVRLKIEAGEKAPVWLRDAPYSVPMYHVAVTKREFDTYYVWHPTYVDRLTTFLTALGAYLDSPSFPYRSTIVGIGVPAGPAFAEMITPGWATSFLDAQDPAPAYTKAAYAAAWKRAIDTMAFAFPTIPLMINLSETWDESVSPTKGIPPNDWVAREVGEYATSRYPTKIEFSNDSVPGTFPSLVSYFQAKAGAGIAVSAQIDWFTKLTSSSSDGGVNVTATELEAAYKFAYDFGARAIEVNKKAFTDPTLRVVTVRWDPVLKGITSTPPVVSNGSSSSTGGGASGGSSGNNTSNGQNATGQSFTGQASTDTQGRIGLVSTKSATSSASKSAAKKSFIAGFYQKVAAAFSVTLLLIVIGVAIFYYLRWKKAKKEIKQSQNLKS